MKQNSNVYKYIFTLCVGFTGIVYASGVLQLPQDPPTRWGTGWIKKAFQPIKKRVIDPAVKAVQTTREAASLAQKAASAGFKIVGLFEQYPQESQKIITALAQAAGYSQKISSDLIPNQVIPEVNRIINLVTKAFNAPQISEFEQYKSEAFNKVQMIPFARVLGTLSEVVDLISQAIDEPLTLAEREESRLDMLQQSDRARYQTIRAILDRRETIATIIDNTHTMSDHLIGLSGFFDNLEREIHATHPDETMLGVCTSRDKLLSLGNDFARIKKGLDEKTEHLARVATMIAPPEHASLGEKLFHINRMFESPGALIATTTYALWEIAEILLLIQEMIRSIHNNVTIGLFTDNFFTDLEQVVMSAKNIVSLAEQLFPQRGTL